VIEQILGAWRQAPSGVIADWARLPRQQSGNEDASELGWPVDRTVTVTGESYSINECAVGDEVDSLSQVTAAPAPSPGSGGGVGASAAAASPFTSKCWFRLPDCCNLPLKETTLQWDWFNLYEATTQDHCDQAKRKIQWWCCRWGATGKRSPVLIWTSAPKANLPAILASDKSCPSPTAPSKAQLISVIKNLCMHMAAYPKPLAACCAGKCNEAQIFNYHATDECNKACISSR
jgi:hypothetical protein